MQHEFEYASMITYTGNCSIENIGDTCIKASNDIHKCWFIKISSDLGICKIISFGPVYEGEDDNLFLTQFFQYNFEEVNYNEKKLIAKINKFINNGEITQVDEITAEEFQSALEELKNAQCY